MLELSPETERLARRMADHVGRRPEDVIKMALEREARALGVAKRHAGRMTAAEILTFGAKIAARPILDRRDPHEISDDLNAT